MFIPNHRHILLMGYIKNAPKTEEEINVWFENLVSLVRMKVVAGPISKYVTEKNNEGITGCVSLATSHAAIHIWDSESPCFFQFDLYSCSDFTTQEIIEYFDETFGLVEYKHMFIDRNNFDFKVE